MAIKKKTKIQSRWMDLLRYHPDLTHDEADFLCRRIQNSYELSTRDKDHRFNKLFKSDLITIRQFITAQKLKEERNFARCEQIKAERELKEKSSFSPFTDITSSGIESEPYYPLGRKLRTFWEAIYFDVPEFADWNREAQEFFIAMFDYDRDSGLFEFKF